MNRPASSETAWSVVAAPGACTTMSGTGCFVVPLRIVPFTSQVTGGESTRSAQVVRPATISTAGRPSWPGGSPGRLASNQYEPGGSASSRYRPSTPTSPV